MQMDEMKKDFARNETIATSTIARQMETLENQLYINNRDINYALESSKSRMQEKVTNLFKLVPRNHLYYFRH